jgi:hypothetical protein
MFTPLRFVLLKILKAFKKGFFLSIHQLNKNKMKLSKESKTEIQAYIDTLLKKHSDLFKNHYWASFLHEKKKAKKLKNEIIWHEYEILIHAGLLLGLIKVDLNFHYYITGKLHKSRWKEAFLHSDKFCKIEKKLLLSEYMINLIDTHAEKLCLQKIHCIKCGVEVYDDYGVDVIDWKRISFPLPDNVKNGFISDIYGNCDGDHDLRTYRMAICDDCVTANTNTESKSLYLFHDSLEDYKK